MSAGFDVGNGDDGTPAGVVRDAHAHVRARRQKTTMIFTSLHTS
jgi:hypothetical protein